MNVLEKLIDDLILEISGKEVVPLVQALRKKESISEFKLASKLNMTVNQVRNMLYRLSTYNLVDFTKKKDKGNTGYGYIYFWSFNEKIVRELLVSFKNNKINMLKKRVERETSETYFVCPSQCVRFDSTNAMEYEFKCPECGKILIREEGKKNVEKIKREIETIKLELQELTNVEEKEKKLMEKRLEKEREKQKAFIERKKARKKAQRKKLLKNKPAKTKSAKIKKKSKK
ncbi:hypothetical protein HYX16_03970 [Candidatus Woesearchaeota archaeon]|nr:hypothetical protein [Candidatus Woesearchaeota archaeon]